MEYCGFHIKYVLYDLDFVQSHRLDYSARNVFFFKYSIIPLIYTLFQLA